MSILVLSPHLLALIRDMAVLIGVLGKNTSQNIASRLQAFRLVDTVSELQFVPGDFKKHEEINKHELWSCKLNDTQRLYFIPTTLQHEVGFSCESLSINPNNEHAVLLVGIVDNAQCIYKGLDYLFTNYDELRKSWFKSRSTSGHSTQRKTG